MNTKLHTRPNKKYRQTWKRICPTCKKSILHINKDNWRNAIKKQRSCFACGIKLRESNPKMKKARKEFIEKFATKGRNTGKDNSFYGKCHTQKTKKLLKKIDKSYTKTKKFKEKMSKVTRGKNNGMYGKTVYGVWLKKYGQKEADRKLKLCGRRKSKATKGIKNLGKLPSKSSGAGWSGRYKNNYFRSLRELSYIIDVLEKNKYTWQTAEIPELKIKYTDKEGIERYYVPDFLVNKKILVEIKPRALQNLPSTKIKTQAAISFCKKKGLKYEIKDQPLMDTDKIIKLHSKGIINFTPKYEEKMKKYIIKNANKKGI